MAHEEPDHYRRILTYHRIIPKEYLDRMGHMNVEYYMREFDAATWATFALMGIDTEYISQHQRGMAALEQHIRYFKEVREGAVVEVRTAVPYADTKRLHVDHVMVRADTKVVVAHMLQTCIHLDLIARKSCEFAPNIRERVMDLHRQTAPA